MPPVTPDVEHWLGNKKVTGLIISVLTLIKKKKIRERDVAQR